MTSTSHLMVVTSHLMVVRRTQKLEFMNSADLFIGITSIIDTSNTITSTSSE